MGEENKTYEIVVSGVTKRFEKKEGSFLALDEVNLKIDKNEFICVVGPSGCGKTTLMNIIAGKEEREEIARKYIHIVGLDKFAKSYPKELSGGMKQRVAIARAYATNPEVLLMDEPFGALDAQTRAQLQENLLNTWQQEKKTCFFITHDVEEAVLLSTKIIIMSAGPGHVREIIDVGLGYPRNQETKLTPEFNELKNELWNKVYKEYLEQEK